MIVILLFALLLCRNIFGAQSLNDDALKKVGFDQKPGAQVSLSLPFRDESGKPVLLGEYFKKKPVILDLGYYECPMLCSAVLNGMIGALQDIQWKLGRDYEVVCVSIDPAETPALASAKKDSYLKRFGQPGAANGWHFLTGGNDSIHELASDVGFNYAYDPTLHQYAHASGLVILSPSGIVSRYLAGVAFSSADMESALADAQKAKVASPIQQFFLLCFHYSPLTGKYSGTILGGVRVMAVALVVGFVAFVVATMRRSRTRAKKGA